MNSKSFLLVVFVLFSVSSVFCLEKLKIGTLKRGENCDRKAKKGDTLTMHYTVSFINNMHCFVTSYKLKNNTYFTT